MDKLIEIQREIDRKMGNRMIIDKIRAGAYKLRTGEASVEESRGSFYAERYDEEFKQMVKHVDEEEGLQLKENEVRNHAQNLQRQMSEGRRNLTFWVKEKGVAKKDKEDDEKKVVEKKIKKMVKRVMEKKRKRNCFFSIKKKI